MGFKALRTGFIVVLLASLLVMARGTALAIPTLQLYIEGATYELASETWVVGSPNFTLWVLGNVGADGAISNVKLSAAFNSSDTPVLSLTPTTADPAFFPGFAGVPDPSTPDAPAAGPSGSGTSPIMGNGSPLPPHGIYGPGTSFQTFLLGNYTLTDSPIGDYTGGQCPNDPSCSFPFMGQINAYDVSITGDLSVGGFVHFDAFDTIVVGGNHLKAKFAPFSHDSETTLAPEPASLLLLGAGLVALGIWGRRKFGSARG